MKYQYSYFIHPYIVDERKYSQHLLRLLKNKNCSLKILEKEKELNIYTYFLPKIRKYLFWPFGLTKEKLEKLNEFDDSMKSTILSKEECTIFEYKIENQMQAKIGMENGIFFEIRKIEIVCFNSGICFIVFKTILDGEPKIEDVLNFNYKFRDINASIKNLKDYENIRIQTNSLKDISTLEEIVKEIEGNNKDIKELNIDDERFLTFSYMCIEAEKWKDEESFENVKNAFIKFADVMPSTAHINFEEERNNIETVETLKNVKFGLSKQAVVLMASETNTENYTKLPFKFENEYLYTYILALYQKIYLKKVVIEFTKTKNIKKMKQKFMEITKTIYNQEITNDVEGSMLYEKLLKILKVKSLYEQIKTEYDLIYKELNINRTIKGHHIILALIIILIIVNVANIAITLLQ